MKTALDEGRPAVITLTQGKADARGSFTIDGGNAVTFDGKIVLPDDAKRIDISLAEHAGDGSAASGERRREASVHDRTDPAIARHGFFHNETTDTADMLPDPALFASDVPRPIWDGHDDAVRCFAHCFEVTGRDYLRAPAPGSGFTRNFVYTPFGSHVFLWGTGFITMYGRYASHIFPFASMLDNFYEQQHRDGWFGSSYSIIDGSTREKSNLCGRGYNMTAWAEWRNWEWSGDKARVERIYPVLLAYHRWARDNRTWKDGSYFSTGLGCGMDNVVRFDTSKYHLYSHHGFLSWVDVTLQSVMDARFLVRMARLIGTDEGVAELAEEAERLARYANERMWDPEAGIYRDLGRDGLRTPYAHAGTFWALLAGVASEDPARVDALARAAFDQSRFAGACGICSTSKDSPGGFRADGGNYWQGGSWCLLDSMAAKGFEAAGRPDVAHRVARRAVEGVAKVFDETGYVWESYHPMRTAPGCMSKGEREQVRRFVGFSGTVPVMLLVENVLGVRVGRDEATGERSVLWDVRLLERHGMENLVLADGTRLSLLCEARKSQDEKPRLTMTATHPTRVKVVWQGGERLVEVGRHVSMKQPL